MGCVFLVKYPLPFVLGGLSAMPGEGPKGRHTSLHALFFYLLGRRWAKVLFQGPEHPFNQDTAAGKDERGVFSEADGYEHQVHVCSPYLFPLFTPSLVLHNLLLPPAGPKSSLGEAEGAPRPRLSLGHGPEIYFSLLNIDLQT